MKLEMMENNIYILVYKGDIDVGYFGYLVQYDSFKDDIILWFDMLRGWRTHKKENCKLVFQVGDYITLKDNSKYKVRDIRDKSICIDYANSFKWINCEEIIEYNNALKNDK